MTLYIAGDTPQAHRAIETVQRICQDASDEDCELEIVDIEDRPEENGSTIVATPALVREHPPPTVRLIGDLSDREALLRTLDLPTRGGLA